MFMSGGYVYKTNPDGTGAVRLPASSDFWAGVNPRWSPAGSTISISLVVYQGGYEIHTLSPDGSNLFRVTHAQADDSGTWSPDGRKFLEVRPGCRAPDQECTGPWDIYTVNADGSGETLLLNDAPSYSLQSITWQSIPINAYPRPKSATPTYVPMAVAYGPCGSATKVHAAPLSFGSCTAQQASSQLTVGTPDANSRQPNGGGSCASRRSSTTPPRRPTSPT